MKDIEDDDDARRKNENQTESLRRKRTLFKRDNGGKHLANGIIIRSVDTSDELLNNSNGFKIKCLLL